MRWFGWFRKLPEGYCQCRHAKCFHGIQICMKAFCGCMKYVEAGASGAAGKGEAK